MAGYQLIDAYVLGLRRRLAWRLDVDDVIAEAEDHLLSAVERLIDGETSSESAQREVLDRFGDPTTVATAFAATSNGGLAVPTTFTRRAGFAAMLAAGLWAAFAAFWLVDDLVDPSGAAGRALPLLAMASLVLAAASNVIVVMGLNRRHGGLGPLGTIGLALAGLGAVATLLFWFVMGWGVLLAIGMMLVALAVHSRGLAPRAATVAFGAAWTVGVLTWSALRILEVGTRDEWGDFPIVSPIAITVGVTVLLPGLIGLGRWLSTELPVDLDSPESVAAA